MADLNLIITSTVQAVILSAISNILGQLITCHQSNVPYTVDIPTLSRFITFSLLACPPNVLWQSFLEHRFPGYTTTFPSDKTAAPSSKDDKPLAPRRSLNKRNTAIKFLLDQSIGALVNTVAFIGGMAALRGERDWSKIAARVGEETVPLMLAGQKLWPAVSLVSFTVVPLEWRTGFGGLVGVFWGVYLTLVEGRRR